MNTILQIARMLCDGKTHKQICLDLGLRLGRFQQFVGIIRHRAKIPWSWSTVTWRARKRDILANLEVSYELQEAKKALEDQFACRYVDLAPDD